MSRLGGLLLAVGVLLLAWVGWQVEGTTVVARHGYRAEQSAIERSWQSPEPRRPRSRHQPAGGPALLSVPAIGLHDVPVLAGISEAVLARGVGHYLNGTGPGQVGNYALAGHRITHGQPFARLLDLDRGDRVIITTRTAVYTYVLDTAPRRLTVTDAAGWVLRRHGDQRRLTLTTCADLFHSDRRSVGFGHLSGSRQR